MNSLRLLGYLLLIISTLLWCILPVLPFLDLTPVQMASYGSAIFIAAEITWWACVPLLGKELIEKGKALISKYWTNKPEIQDKSEFNESKEAISAEKN